MNTIDKLDLRTPDFVSENIEKLAALFPHCVTETAEGRKIDFDLLQQELSHDIVEGNRERYRLEWPGKREAIVTANLPTTKTLRPVREDSVDFDNTENLYIEGDNLEVLKLLQESYFGKIKMIYIDPPYNTGNDFVYKDNFATDRETELFESGQIDEYGKRMVANPETSGRYHSDWLTMMYPRLKLARNLLTDDGAIFISIDDNEVHNLRKLCDEVFGEGNFIGSICRATGTTTAQGTDSLGKSFDYILSYSKIQDFIVGGIALTEKDKLRYDLNDENGSFSILQLRRTGGEDRREDRPSMYYGIQTPDGEMVYPKGPTGYDSRWRVGEDTYKRMLKNNEIYFKKTDNGYGVYYKFYLEGRTKRPSNLWNDIEGNKKAQIDLKELIPEKIFDTPKPIELITRTIQIANADNNSIILDFFSGSATTAHAVMQLNSEDGGNRKFIMVQLPEQTDEKSEAYKAGYKNICEIGKERIRRASKTIVNGQLSILNEKKQKLEKIVNGQLLIVSGEYAFPEGLIIDETAEQLLKEINHLQLTINHYDNGFRVYRLADSNMQDVYYRPQDYKQEQLAMFADNIKPDRTADDLLAQVMLDWGLPLSYRIEQIDVNGKQVFRVAQDSLLACFDKGIDEAFAKEIAKEKPLRVVFRDSGFASDTAKINVQQLLKQLSPETEMKVI